METQYLNIREVARQLRVGYGTVRKLLKAGDLESYKIGAQWRITQEQVDAYLEKTKTRVASN